MVTGDLRKSWPESLDFQRNLVCRRQAAKTALQCVPRPGFESPHSSDLQGDAGSTKMGLSPCHIKPSKHDSSPGGKVMLPHDGSSHRCLCYGEATHGPGSKRQNDGRQHPSTNKEQTTRMAITCCLLSRPMCQDGATNPLNWRGDQPQRTGRRPSHVRRDSETSLRQRSQQTTAYVVCNIPGKVTSSHPEVGE